MVSKSVAVAYGAFWSAASVKELTPDVRGRAPESDRVRRPTVRSEKPREREKYFSRTMYLIRSDDVKREGQ